MQHILDVYDKYHIMPSLREHMLRVAAVASLICDHWQGEELDRKSIVTACLLHDMGNIIKIDLTTPGSVPDKDKDYWVTIKNKFMHKYGTQDHYATLQIATELGQSKAVIDLLDQFGHINFCVQKHSKFIEGKIVNYADNRVSPFGVVSYKERIEEVTPRYRTLPWFAGEEKHQEAILCGYEVEEQIFRSLDINSSDINNASIAKYLDSLKRFVLE